MSSQPTNEQWTGVSKLVSSFLQRPDAEPFREPVDWQNLGLFDYPKIIKKPMDLGTIKKSVMDRKYKNLKNVDDDVKLVWTNCMTYNADGSDFFILAQNLNKKWIDKYTKLLNDFQLNPDGTSITNTSTSNDRSNNKTSSTSNNSSGSATNGKISLDEKRSFAKSLYKITKEDLGKILVQVENKCPAALTKNSAEDEVEFNVDKLTSAAFHDLVIFVKNCTNNSSSSGNSTNNKTAGSASVQGSSSVANGGNSSVGSTTKSKKNTKRQKI